MDKNDDLKQALLYQPKLLPFESERDYRLLEDAIRNHISPQDILEEIWTSEIIEGEWETVRLRRHKNQIVSLATPSARFRSDRRSVQLAFLHSLRSR